MHAPAELPKNPVLKNFRRQPRGIMKSYPLEFLWKKRKRFFSEINLQEKRDTWIIFFNFSIIYEENTSLASYSYF